MAEQRNVILPKDPEKITGPIDQFMDDHSQVTNRGSGGISEEYFH